MIIQPELWTKKMIPFTALDSQLLDMATLSQDTKTVPRRENTTLILLMDGEELSLMCKSNENHRQLSKKDDKVTISNFTESFLVCKMVIEM